MSSKFSVAVAGAHTAVGREILRALEEREFPSLAVTALAPEGHLPDESASEPSDSLKVLTPDAFQGADLAFFAGDAKLSRAFVPAALNAGAYVVDISSEHRADAAVPLCVPGVAPLVRSERRIAACPDPLAAAVAQVTAPLKAHQLRRVTITSLHSVSTRGAAAVRELEKQTAALMNARPPELKVFRHRVAFNAFPQVGEPSGLDYGDERAVASELPRILDIKELAVGCTCIRVPIFFGNAASVICEAESPLDPEWVREQFTGSAFVKVLDHPQDHVFPTTQLAVGDEAVLIGRIRPDQSRPRSVAFFIAYDAIRLAAVNAIQVAEAIAAG